MPENIMTPRNFARTHRRWRVGILLVAVTSLVALAGSGSVFAQDAQNTESAEDAINPDLAYLEEFRQREGVIVRPSGLQIRIIEFKEGDIPGPESSVIVHYEGKLVDGTVFDSTYARGQPAEFPVGGVIRGWTEALMMMQTGSKWEIVVPADIGYGDDGRGESIPGGATLIFTVELLEVR